VEKKFIYFIFQVNKFILYLNSLVKTHRDLLVLLILFILFFLYLVSRSLFTKAMISQMDQLWAIASCIFVSTHFLTFETFCAGSGETGREYKTSPSGSGKEADELAASQTPGNQPNFLEYQKQIPSPQFSEGDTAILKSLWPESPNAVPAAPYAPPQPDQVEVHQPADAYFAEKEALVLSEIKDLVRIEYEIEGVPGSSIVVPGAQELQSDVADRIKSELELSPRDIMKWNLSEEDKKSIVSLIRFIFDGNG
jgi:hypothetical protein